MLSLKHTESISNSYEQSKKAASNILEQRLANYSPQAKSGQPPHFLSFGRADLAVFGVFFFFNPLRADLQNQKY